MPYHLTFQTGGPPIVNADGTALRYDHQWSVDFGTLSPEISVTLAYKGKISAAEMPGGLALWASAVSGDNSGTAALLGLLELPVEGTVGVFVDISQTFLVPNPGGVLWLVLTSFGGENGEEEGFESIELDYSDVVVDLHSPPVITIESPAAGSIGTDAQLVFTATTIGTLTDLEATVTDASGKGALAYDNGTFNDPFFGTVETISNGVRVTIGRTSIGWPLGSLRLDVHAEDDV